MSGPALEIVGEEEVLAAFDSLARLAENLEAPHKTIVSRLVPEIAARTPVRTGALARSWQGTGTATSADILSPLPYAGPVEFGTPRMAGAHMVGDVLASSTDEIVATYEQAFAAEGKRLGFGVSG